MAKQLAIIIPGCNEFPQNTFTVQNVVATLRHTPLDFEVIYIDNQSTVEPNWMDNKGKPWVRTIHYDDKLSHWCAKNVGIQNSTADTLFFMDAHCIIEPNALLEMFKVYKTKPLNGTLHMPINYMLEAPGKELVYKLLYNYDEGIAHYSFRRMTERVIHKIPCMSTCGMMVSREIIQDKLGMWPWELGIYGGGENFINFTLAVLGLDVNIWPFKPIHHYAYKRGYSWNYDDWLRNRMIAIYVAGGEGWLKRFSDASKGRPEVKEAMRLDVMSTCKHNREHIKSQQKYTLEEWAKKMRLEKPLYWHPNSV